MEKQTRCRGLLGDNFPMDNIVVGFLMLFFLHVLLWLLMMAIIDDYYMFGAFHSSCHVHI